MMENSIVPSVDQLQLRDLYHVLKVLKLHRIGKQIYYDFLATEYVRKYKTEQVSFENNCFIVYALCNGRCDLSVLDETLKVSFHDFVHAFFLLSKVNWDDELKLEPGVYNAKTMVRIEEAAKMIQQT